MSGMGDPNSAAKRDAGNQSDDWRSSNVSLMKRYEYIFNNKLYADVSFIVGEGDTQTITANKAILSGGSVVFHTMFSENWSSDQSEIEILDIEPAAFVELLRFIYYQDANLTKDIVWSVYYAAEKYCIDGLKNKCHDFVKGTVCPDNVVFMLMKGRLFYDDELMCVVLEMLDTNTLRAVSSKDFLKLDIETLCFILRRCTSHIREIDLFKAVVEWAAVECKRNNLSVSPENRKVVLEEVLPLIRYPLMTLEEFSCNVPDSGLLSEKEQLSMLLYFTKGPRPPTSFIENPPRRFVIRVTRQNTTLDPRMPSFEMAVSPDNSIRQLKVYIKCKDRLCSEHLQLLFNGRVLRDDNSTVSKCGMIYEYGSVLSYNPLTE